MEPHLQPGCFTLNRFISSPEAKAGLGAASGKWLVLMDGWQGRRGLRISWCSGGIGELNLEAV